MDLSIIPECFVDTNLIETLVSPQKQYNHQKGCGTVAKVMQEKFSDAFALGIIDKDKVEVDYLKKFDEICKRGNLILHKHKTNHHYFIQICPAMEQFMLNNANEAGLILTDYYLPLDIKALKKLSKSTTSKNDQRFKSLFKALIAHETEDIKRLKGWIIYLKETTYKATLKELEEI